MCTGRSGIARARFGDLSILIPMLVIPSPSGVAAQTDMRFAMVQIDGGAAESAATADFNNDGKLDIVSAESWYEAPRGIKRPIRTIPAHQRLCRLLQRLRSM